MEKCDGRSDFSAILKRQFKFNTSHFTNEDRLVGSSYVEGKKRRIRDKVKSVEISSLEAERQIAALNNTYGKTSIYADKDKDEDDETIGYENVLEAPGSNVEDILMNCDVSPVFLYRVHLDFYEYAAGSGKPSPDRRGQ
ncbi:MAG: hypothetical protein MR908_03825 [Firmicutes bacterium]|nr:hypothetical protein [Bacillota bacterium]